MAAGKKKVAKKNGAAATKPVAALPPAVPAPLLVKVRDTKVDKEKTAALNQYLGQMRAGGGGMVIRASEAISTYGLRRPCGITQLDIDCAGGLPAGGLSMLAGPDGAGKSELLYLYYAQHQRIYGEDSRIALSHTEGQFDFWRAKRLGMQIAIPELLIQERREIRAMRGQADLTKEDLEYLRYSIGEFVLIENTVGEATLDAVLAAVRSTAFGIVAVDSIQGLIPQADADKDLDEVAKRSAFATMMTRFIQLYTPLSAGLSKPNYTTLILISQVRANQDKGSNAYAPDFIMQVARSVKHMNLVVVEITTGQKLHKTVGGEKLTIGKELKWKISKGKAGAHDNVTGSTDLIYPEHSLHGQSIDTVSSVITTGMRYGVIREDTRTGKAFVVRPSEQDKQVFDPSPNVKTLEMMMRVDPDLEQMIRQEILLAANLTCRYQ